LRGIASRPAAGLPPRRRAAPRPGLSAARSAMGRRRTCARCAAVGLLALLHLDAVGSGPLKWASSVVSRMRPTAKLRSSAMDTGPPRTAGVGDDAAGDLTARAGRTSEHSRRLQQAGVQPEVSAEVADPKVTHMAPTRGPVLGSTRVSVSGSDFSPHGNYTLTFSSTHFAKTTTFFECGSSSSVAQSGEQPAAGSCDVLVFTVPIWGASFDLLYAAVETDVVLYSNLAPVYMSNETVPLRFLYEPTWEPGSLGPATAGPVLGGTGKTCARVCAVVKARATAYAKEGTCLRGLCACAPQAHGASGGRAGAEFGTDEPTCACACRCDL